MIEYRAYRLLFHPVLLSLSDDEDELSLLDDEEELDEELDDEDDELSLHDEEDEELEDEDDDDDDDDELSLTIEYLESLEESFHLFHHILEDVVDVDGDVVFTILVGNGVGWVVGIVDGFIFGVVVGNRYPSLHSLSDTQSLPSGVNEHEYSFVNPQCIMGEPNNFGSPRTDCCCCINWKS